MEALAVGVRPGFSVRTVLHVERGRATGVDGVAAQNVSAWPATDLGLEIRYRDGHVEPHTRERMDPSDPAWTVPAPGVQLFGADGYERFPQTRCERRPHIFGSPADLGVTHR